MGHNRNSYSITPVQPIQLTSRLRYYPLNDEKGEFGLLVVHDGGHVNYTIQIESEAELRAAIESYQDNPVGVNL